MTFISIAPSAPPATTEATTPAIIGTVLDPSGAPVPDVIVSAQQAGKKMRDPIQVSTDADGKFKLENLPEGEYNLKFRTRDGKFKGTATARAIEGKTTNAGKVKLRLA
jgi:5-hydroxyisourate hydrolase-like protein (transthyretin family)